ncbi:hypothetical protein, partial [Sandaracinomonas limnophila]
TQSEALKELLANKATGITDATNNDTNYPTVKAIKGYVDGAVSVLSTSDSTSAWITRERNRAISRENTIETNLNSEITRSRSRED